MKSASDDGTTIFISVYRWKKYDNVPGLEAQAGFKHFFWLRARVSSHYANPAPWCGKGHHRDVILSVGERHVAHKCTKLRPGLTGHRQTGLHGMLVLVTAWNVRYTEDIWGK